MPNICQAVPVNEAYYIKLNERFQRGICPEHFNSNKYKMADLRPLLTFLCVLSGKTVPDNWTIKQNVRVQEVIGLCPEKCQLDKIQNGRLVAIIDFNICNGIWTTRTPNIS